MTKEFIAIIQTGTAIASAKQKYGDFDNWFIQGMAIDADKVKIYRVFNQLEFPATKHLKGIIITGSSAMVTAEPTWHTATTQWLQQFVDSKIPILGVCYGHQLLANLLGGQVDWNPNGRELGQVVMQVTKDTYQDQLLSAVVDVQTTNVKFLASHQQVIVNLPKDAVLLGTTKLDKYHSFRYKNHIWGLQFHPEFTPDIVKNYIQERKQNIKNEGLDPTQIVQGIEEINNGTAILQRFKEICLGSNTTKHYSGS